MPKTKKGLVKALNFSFLGEEFSDWQEILPGGPLVRGKDGRNYFLSDAQRLVNFLNDKTANERIADVPLDVNHAIDRKAWKGEHTPAHGWYKEFRINDAGNVEGRLEPNDGGAWMIANKDYRYLSPAILYDPDTLEILDIEAVSLTNNPNFNLRALNDAQEQPSTVEEKPMFEKLRKLFGLEASATEDDVEARVKRALHDSEVLAGLATDLGIEGEPTKEIFAKALHDRSQAAGSATPSLADFVPRSDYDALLGRVDKTEKAVHDRELADKTSRIKGLIAKALHDRKITPASVDYHKTSMATESGIEAFEKFVGDSAPLLPEQMERAEHDTKGGLSASEQEVCSLLGVDQEQFKAQRKE